MTERASDLLGELSDRLTADVGETAPYTADSIRMGMPDLVQATPDGMGEMPIKSSATTLTSAVI